MQLVIGIVAMLVLTISDLSYVRAIWKSYAQPQRFTWFIFCLTAAVIFGSQLGLGSTTSLFVFGWFLIVNIVIFSLSLMPGKGKGGTSYIEQLMLLIAIISVILWFDMGSPLVALICILVADTIGIGLSLVKTWSDPYSEPLMMWGLGSVAALLNIFAVSGGSWYYFLAPVHLLVCDVAMATVIVLRRPHNIQAAQSV